MVEEGLLYKKIREHWFPDEETPYPLIFADTVFNFLNEAKAELEQAEKGSTPLERFLQYRQKVTKWFGKLPTENEYSDDSTQINVKTI